jgi:nucleoside-diphosphate-sugar epimerase
VSYDIVPAPADAWRHPAIEWVVGDVCDVEHMARAFAGADCVWHNAAAVGPFHPHALHLKVNYEGTLRVLEACRRARVRKVVMSSSPSTRFEWAGDYDGVTEAQMAALPQAAYVQSYAATKAMGEIALREANGKGGMATVAVAPHQVYGPRDNLFLPNILEAGGSGRLRVFGSGENRICFTHVDNYAHGLIIAERAL